MDEIRKSSKKRSEKSSENSETVRNWRYSKGCKGILIVVMQFMAIALAFSIVVIFTYSSFRTEGISMMKNPEFSTSQVMSEMLESDAERASSFVIEKSDFENEGQYDPEKLIDIRQYYDSQAVTGTNYSGLSYTVKQLRDWSSSVSSASMSSSSDQSTQRIRVCEKIDGTYTYYTQQAFIALIETERLYLFNQETGKLMKVTDTDKSLLGSSEYVEGKTKVEIVNGGSSAIQSVEANGGVVYTDTWDLDIISEKYAPAGYKSLIELANNDSRVNGNLEEYNRELKSVLSHFASDIDNYEWCNEAFAENNSNFVYVFVNQDTHDVYTNRSVYSDYSQLSNTKQSLKSLGRYIFVESTLAGSETNTSVSMEYLFQKMKANLPDNNFSIYIGIDTSFPISDTYYEAMRSYEMYAPWFTYILEAGIISLFGIVFLLIWITIVAGRTGRGSAAVLNVFDRIPLEIDALLMGLPSAAAIYIMVLGNDTDEISYYTWKYNYPIYSDPSALFTMSHMVTIILCTLACSILMLSLYLTIIRRMKAGKVWHSTLLYYICKGLKRLYEERSVTVKTLLSFLAFLMYNIAAFSSRTTGLILIAAVIDAGVLIMLMKSTIARRKILDGITRISEGDLTCQIDTRGLRGSELQFAESINHLGEGFQKAVDSNIKNERLKTDLITNVSHDIKTPLTTIINYVGILKQSDIDDPRIQSYIDILERKSLRLKHLTEDLVEASKISSGNIELQFMLLNYAELIHQAAGECEEKLTERGLTLVMNLPGDPVTIMADGRRLFRVLENLFTNAAKYAMPHTRVYVDLSVTEDGMAVMQIKNVSEQQLNIPAEELTERFIRGDLSRSSEGSGLGLSIAKNLTELQHGKFDIYLDGDLFRVTVAFQVYVKPAVKPAQQKKASDTEKNQSDRNGESRGAEE